MLVQSVSLFSNSRNYNKANNNFTFGTNTTKPSAAALRIAKGNIEEALRLDRFKEQANKATEAIRTGKAKPVDLSKIDRTAGFMP